MQYHYVNLLNIKKLRHKRIILTALVQSVIQFTCVIDWTALIRAQKESTLPLKEILVL